MSFLQEIVKQYPIRKSREEKDAFLKYAQAQARRMGYKATVSEDARHRNFVAGDPDKAGDVIIDVIESENPPLRLLLGSDAVKAVTGTLKQRLEEIAAWEDKSVKTDF